MQSAQAMSLLPQGALSVHESFRQSICGIGNAAV